MVCIMTGNHGLSRNMASVCDYFNLVVSFGTFVISTVGSFFGPEALCFSNLTRPIVFGVIANG